MAAGNLSAIGRLLATGLTRLAKEASVQSTRHSKVQKVNVVGAGGALTAAYEQLRNAAENTEEHLLLQNAIKRFYKQLFLTRDEQLLKQSGNELAVELTLAGYVANDSLTKQQLNDISELALEYYRAYETLYEQRIASTESITAWTLGVLAVRVEAIINHHERDILFAEVAYQHFKNTLPTQGQLFDGKKVTDFEAALYVSIYRALLKADDAMIRTVLLDRYQVGIEHLERFALTNKGIDELFASKTTDTLVHVVNRRGAPLRILRRMIESRDDVDQLLPKHNVFLEEYEKQVNIEYGQVGQRINRAIVRSVIFLIITKMLIGILIEIPYDLWRFGHIAWVPLVINLLFPPIYMVLLKFTFMLPSAANTAALVDAMDAMMYGEREVLARAAKSERRHSTTFSVVYAVSGVAVFALVSWLLWMLNFTIVHIVIFFVFLSAASFLGFRLSRLIRELEVVKSSQNGATLVRDILYLPFVVVGRWMSDKYARLNIVTIVLDMIIELPLKTILRLVRQWSAFIDERKDAM